MHKMGRLLRRHRSNYSLCGRQKNYKLHCCDHDFTFRFSHNCLIHLWVCEGCDNHVTRPTDPESKQTLWRRLECRHFNTLVTWHWRLHSRCLMLVRFSWMEPKSSKEKMSPLRTLEEEEGSVAWFSGPNRSTSYLFPFIKFSAFFSPADLNRNRGQRIM